MEVKANLIIVTMAWLTREKSHLFSRLPHEPDLESLIYWVQRLEPVIKASRNDEVIVVFCNRSGVEDGAVYSGTSAVIGIKDGEVIVYGLLGRGVKELLVVDTKNRPFAKLVDRHALSSMGAQAWGKAKTQTGVPRQKTGGGQPYFLQSPTTPKAISLLDHGVIPEEDPMSPGLPKHPAGPFMDCLTPAEHDKEDSAPGTPIEDEPATFVSKIPNGTTAPSKPKLVIATSEATPDYQPSPYPWQQDGNKAVILAGNVAINTAVTSPTTPFDMEDSNSTSPPTATTATSVSYPHAMAETPIDTDLLTPLSPQSPTTLWKEPAISFAIASLRRRETVPQSLDNLVARTGTPERDPLKEIGGKEPFSSSTTRATQGQGMMSLNAELADITESLQLVALGTTSSQNGEENRWAEEGLDKFLDRPQSPKSRNASQTRVAEGPHDPADLSSAHRRLSLSRNSTPGDIGLEIESWRPRSNPIVDGWTGERNELDEGQDRSRSVAGVRSRSVSDTDRLERLRVRSSSVQGVYSGGSPFRRPPSVGRGHRALTPRGVRRTFDGPQMRRVSRGRQPAAKKLLHERSSSTSSPSHGVIHVLRGSSLPRAATATPPPPPPLDGMVVLDMAPRHRSFSRGRPVWADAATIHANKPKLDFQMDGRNSPSLGYRFPHAAKTNRRHRSSLSESFTANDTDQLSSVVAPDESDNSVPIPPVCATPKVPKVMESGDLEGANTESREKVTEAAIRTAVP